MARKLHLRQHLRPLRRGVLLVAGLAAFAGLTLGLRSVVGASSSVPAPVPRFVAESLGKPQPATPPVEAGGVRSTVVRRGVTAASRRGSVSILSLAARPSGWKHFAGGALRPNRYGYETVTLTRGGVEELQTVTTRQGLHTWRWQLAAPGLDPKSRVDGSVGFTRSGKPVGLHVLPVDVFDRAGNAVTPAGARWRLERSGGNWWLELRLDDRKLPVPYTIDPSVSSVSFSGSPQTGGARSLWTVGFTSSTAGPLNAGKTITVTVNPAFTVPATPAITLGTGFISCTATASTTLTTVTITLAGSSCTLPANTPAMLGIAGITNPVAASYLANTFSVQTSVDSTSAVNPGAAVVVGAATAPTAVAFTGSPQTGGARSTWTAGFTTSATGALRAGDTITAVFNATFTVPATPGIVLGAAFSNCSATGSATAQNVTVTLADSGGTCALANGTAATLTIAGLTNPSAGSLSNATFSLKTSADTTAANPGSNVVVAAATAPSAVSFNGSRLNAGAAPATWTVGFTSTATGALRAGDTITAAFNSGFTLPATPTVTLGGAFSNCSATGSAAAQTLTVTLANNGGTCALASSAAATFTVAGLTNPGAGTLLASTFSVKTSADAAAANPGSNLVITAATTPTSISFAGSPQTGLARSTWTLGFTASASGALAAGDTITAVFNSGFTVPATPTITLTGGFTNCSATGSATAQTVTITLANSAGTCALANSAAATLKIAGVTNPAAATLTSTTFTLKSSADTTAASPGSNVVIAAATKITKGTPTASPTTASALALWTVPFTTSATGALGAGDTISITYPSGSVPATPEIGLVSNFTNCSATGSGSGLVVTITLADSGGTCAVAASSVTSLTIDGITNGTANMTLAVKTSTDTTSANENATTINAASKVTKGTPTATSLAASARAIWTVPFTTSANGALSAGATIDVTFPAGFTVPASTTASLSGFTNCSATATGSGLDATVTLANSGGTCSLGATSAGSVILDGITNPATTGNKTLAVSTSSDAGSQNENPATVVAATSVTAGAPSAAPQTAGARSTWTVPFTVGASGALRDGDSITITYPGGYTIPATSAITLVSGFTNCAASGAGAGQVVTITVSNSGGTCAVANSAAVSFKVAGVTNTATTGNSTITVKTSVDTGGPVSETAVNIGSATTLAGGTPSASPQTAASRAIWTVPFSLSSSGALKNGDTITVTYPGGYTLPAAPAITLVSGFSYCAATGSGSGQVVTITLADNGGTCAAAASASVSLKIAGVTNTSTTGSSVLTVKTSADVAAVANENGATIAASTAPTSVTFTGSPQTASSHASWTVGFTTSGSGALRDGDTITAAFDSSFTVAASLAVSLGGAFSNCSATAAASGTTVTVTLADSGGTCALGNTTAATLTLGGITNPAAATITGTNFTVKTSADVNTASPANVTIAGSSTPTGVTFSASSRAANATGTTWTVGFTATADGALAAGEAVTVAFPSGFTLPATPAIGLTGGFSNCTASGSTLASSVKITLYGASCALAASSAGTLTIGGITNPGAGTYANTAFTVRTTTDTNAAAAGAGIDIFGPATQLAFTTQPGGTINGGSAFGTQPVVTVEDAGGRTVANDNSTQVTLAIGTNPSGGTLSGCSANPATASGGVVTFAGCKIDKSGAGYTLTTSNGASLTNATSASFTVSVGPATKLVFTTQPGGTITGGSAFGTQPVVKVEDAGGNVVTGDNSTQVTLSIGTNPAGGSLGCTTNPVTASSGVVTFAGCKIDRAGAGYTLTTSNGSSLTNDTSSSFTVSVGPAVALAVTSVPAGSVTAGASFSVTVEARDAGGNAAPVVADTAIQLNPSGAGTISNNTGTITAATNSKTLTAVQYTKAEALTLTAHRTGGDSLTDSPASGTITVVAAAASKLAVTSVPGGNVTAGSNFSVTVTSQDAYGNASAVVADTAFQLNPSGAGTISNNTGTITAATNSKALTTVQYTKAEALTLTAHRTAGDSLADSAASGTITLVPGAISTVTSTITAAPGSITANGSSTSTVTAHAKDANGNDLTSGGASVKLSTTAGSFPSSCTTDCAATDNGDGTYSLTLTSSTVAGAVTLTGKIGASSMTNTGSVTFAPGPISTATSTITAAPGSITADGSSTTTVTVQAKDANGNNLTSGGSTVKLTATGGTFPSSCTTDCTATDNGNGTYSLTLTSPTVAGAVTLSGKIGGSAMTNTGGVTFTPGPISNATSTITTSPGSITADGSSTTTVTVHAKDVNGNNLTSGGSTIKLTTTAGTFPSSCTTDCTATDNGNGTYSLTLTSSTTAGSVTVGGKIGGSAMAQTGGVTFTPGTATQLVFTTQPAGATAGSSFGQQPVVKVEDANGNVVTSGADSTVSVTMSVGSGGGSLQGTTAVVASGGVATFTDLRLDTSGSHTLTAGATLSISGAVSRTSSSFTISAAAATRLAVTGSAAQTAGGSQTITITATDPYGNTDTSFSGNKTLVFSGATSSPNPATAPTVRDRLGSDQPLGANTSISFSNGQGTALTTLYNAETAHLAAADSADSIPASTGSDRLTTTVSPAAATRLAVTVSAAQTAGGSQTITITATDPYGNTDTSFSGNKTLVFSGATSSPNPATAPTVRDRLGSDQPLGANTSISFSNGQGTALTTLYNAETAHLAAADSADSIPASTGSDRLTTTVSAAAATRLAVTGSGAQTAGGSQTITITATDPYGNTDTSFSGNKTLVFSGASSSPDPATAPTVRDRLGSDQPLGANTSISFSNGQGTALTTLYNAETAHLAAADSADSIPASTGSDRLTTTVTAAAASRLAFTTQPGGTSTGGSPLGTQPVVAVEDAYGNLVTGDSSNVTLAITNGTGAPGASLSGTATVAASSGSAAFAGLAIDKAGSGYTLTATDGSLTSAVSSPFTVGIGPAAALAFSTQPAGAAGGSAFGTQPVVDVVDAGGNRVTSDSSSVTVAIKAGTGAGGAVLAGTATVSASSGRATFSGLSIDKAGTSYKLRATDGSLTAADSAAFDVTVGGAAKLAFTTQPSSSTGGTAFGTQPAVEVEDAGGNRVTSSSTAVTLAIKAGTGTGGATLGGTATVNASSGVATFSGLSIDKTGTNYQLRATAGILTATDSSTLDISLGPVSASASTVSASPSAVAADGTTTSTITVTLTDAGGNPVSAKAVTLAQGTGNSSISAASGPSNSSGVVTFTATNTVTETVTYTATDTTDSVTLGQTAAVAFSAVDANESTVAAGPSSVVADGSTTSTITVTLRDGNDVPVVGKSVSLSQGAGQSTISAASGPSDSSGVVTFTVKSTVAETVTYTATASGVTIAQTAQVTFTPGAAAKLAFTSNTSSVGSAASKTLTVEVRDAHDNLLADDNSTVVTFAKTAGAATVSGLGTATASGGIVSLTVTGQALGSITATASKSGLTSDSSTFSVVVGAADHLTFTSSGAGVASGSTKTLTAEIRDANGNVETGDSSTVVTFAKTAGTGTVTGLGNVTATAGVATLTVTGQAAGSVTITASKAGLTSDTSTFSVAAGAADHLTFTSSGASVASASTKTLTAEVRDAYGNLESGDSSTVVTFAKTAGAGTVSGLGNATASGGVATLTVTGVAAGSLDVTASKSGLTSDTSTFSVTPGPADHLTFTSNGTSVTSGSTKTLTAEIRDANGNLETSDSSTVVTFARTAGAGTVTGLGTTTASSGVATLTVTGLAAGSLDVTAGKSGLTSDTSTFSVTPGTADHLTFTSDGASVASGSTKTLSAEIRDANGNVETGDSSTVVTFAKTAGTGTVSGLGNATASGGVATLTVTGVAAGSLDVTASKSGLTSDISTFAVTPGPADHLTFTSNGTSIASGSTKTLTAEIRDAAGNLETADNSTVVTFAKTAGTGTVTGLGTATASGGVAGVTVTGVAVGSLDVTASKSGVTSDTTTFSVTPGPADHLTFTSDATGIGSTQTKTLTVAVRDANDNLEAGDNSTVVTFAKTAGAGTVTGLGSATASGGVAGLTVTGETVGALTITASKSGLTGDSTTFSVTTGPADHLQITSANTDLLAGTTRNVTAQVVDANGNLVNDNSTQVTLSQSGAGTATGLPATLTASGGNVSKTVTGHNAGAITVTAHAAGLSPDATSSFAVLTGGIDAGVSTVGAANATTSTDTGSTNTVTVAVRDVAGNPILGAGVTLTQALSGGGASHSTIAPSLTGGATGTATTDVSGVATFTVSDSTVEGVVYSATASGTPLTQTAGVTFTAGNAYKLVFQVQPANAGAGQPITPAIKVKILDEHDNLTSSTAAVLLAIDANPSGGTITGDGPVSAVAGVATFPSVSIDQVGNAYTLDATSPGLVTATSNPFNIVVAPGLSFSAVTGDAYHPAATNTVYFRSNGGSGSFTLTASPAGQARYDFPGLGSGWSPNGQHTAAASVTYSFSSGAAEPGDQTVTYNDGTSDSGPTTFDVTDDSTAPSGGAVNLPGSAYDTTGSFNVSVVAATDGDSGLASQTLQRQVRTLSGNSCSGTFTDDGAAGAVGGGNVAESGLATGCYRWVLTATDHVGNTATFASGTIMVDRSGPTAPTLSTISPLGTGIYYSGTGATVFAQPGADATNSFAVTAASSDPDSGVASYSFPSINGFTKNVTGDTATYVAASPGTSDGGSGVVTATNNAGAASAAGFTLNVVVDGSAPVSTGFTSPGAVGYSTDGHESVTWNAFSDTGSGVTTVNLKRQVATLANNACTGWQDDPTFVPPAITPATTSISETNLTSGNCYRYVLSANDHLNNATDPADPALTSAAVLVDTSKPTTPTLASLVAAGANVHAIGSTVYFKPGADATNSFTVTAAATDPESGLNAGSWAYASLPGFGAPSVSGAAATYTAASPAAGAGGSGSATVDDNAGLTSLAGAGFTVTADAVAPAGGSITVPDYSGNGSARLTLGLYTDAGGAGLATQTLERWKAPFTAGVTCGTFVDDGPVVPGATTVSESGLSDGYCYHYVLTATDNVGNTSSVTSSDIKVDMSQPTAPSLTFDALSNAYDNAGTLFYNPALGGGFRVTASSTNAVSGVAGYTFSDLAGHGFVRTGGGSQYSYTFGLSSTDTTSSVTATSVAGVTSPATNYTLTADSAAPDAPTFSCGGGPCQGTLGASGTTVTITDNGDGSGSGVASILVTTDGSDPASSGTASVYSGPITIGASEAIRAIVVDNVGNKSAETSKTFTVDSTAPQQTLADVAGTTLKIHFDEQLDPGSVPDASAFAVTITSGTPPVTAPTTVNHVAVSGSTLTLVLGTTNGTGGTVTYTKPGSNPVQDRVGNETASFSFSFGLDTTPPSATAASVDGTTLEIDFDEPLETSIVPAASAFAVTADGSAVPVSTVAVSGSAVTLTLGTAVTHGQTVSVTYTQPGSSKLQDDAGNTAATFTSPVTNTTAAGSGGGGGPTTSPQFVSASPADGSTVTAVGPDVTLNANEPVTWSNLQLTVGGGAPQSLAGGTGQSLTIPYASTTPALYTITGTVGDGTTTSSFVTHFTVWTQGSGPDVPPTAKTGIPNQGSGLTTADATSSVQWPGTAVPNTPGDGIVITMTPQPSLAAPSGSTWSAGGTPVDITARTILSNTPLTTFTDPLVIHFPNAGPDDVPQASSDDGATWRILDPLDGPSLPAGRSDGYVRLPGGGIDVYTLHLTVWALARLTHPDLSQPPDAPDLDGYVSDGKLVLRWTKADGAAQYSILVDGKPVRSEGASTFEEYLGPATAADAHVYNVQAVNGDGKASALSQSVTGVPNLQGMTLQQAKDALAARGFKTGSTSGPSPGGVVVLAQSVTAPGYARVGAAIDLTLGAPRAPLTFAAVGTKYVNLRTTHSAAIRVQVNQPATITWKLAGARTTWSRNVPTGAWILRYRIPAGLAPGKVRLTVEAATAGERRALTIPLRLGRGPVVLSGQARIVVVGDVLRTPLALDAGEQARIVPATPTGVYATAFFNPNVAVIVVNIDRQGLALVHDLHLIFPSLRIVAVTSRAGDATRARRFGAAAVVVNRRPAGGSLLESVIKTLLAGFRP